MRTLTNRIGPQKSPSRQLKFHNGPDCSRFQFETATETFFRNVPFHPIDFDTLEIEIQKSARDPSRAFPFAGRFFANRTSANGFLLLLSPAFKSFDWTNLAPSPLTGRI
jgi:hypothetical protein